MAGSSISADPMIKVIIDGQEYSLEPGVVEALTAVVDATGRDIADILTDAIVNEALISEQRRRGRTFFVRDDKQGVAKFDFA